MLHDKEVFVKKNDRKSILGWHTTKRTISVLSMVSTSMVAFGSAIVMLSIVVVTAVFSAAEADGAVLCSHKKRALHIFQDSYSQEQ